MLNVLRWLHKPDMMCAVMCANTLCAMLQIVGHVLIQLIKVHNEGIVHRNITFDTIVFKDNAWRLIGWEHCAKAGSIARIPPRSYYLDAKQLNSLMHKVSSERVRKSVDIWAVAMVFFECVTRKRAFFKDCDRDVDQVWCRSAPCHPYLCVIDRLGPGHQVCWHYHIHH